MKSVSLLGMAIAIFLWPRAGMDSTHQDKIIARIKKMGGQVIQDDKRPGKPVVSVDF